MYKFKTEPYEHQKDALKKCWNKEAFAIFAEMGTGKTKIALDNACILYIIYVMCLEYFYNYIHVSKL